MILTTATSRLPSNCLSFPTFNIQVRALSVTAPYCSLLSWKVGQRNGAMVSRSADFSMAQWMVRSPAVPEPHLGYCPALTKPTKHISSVNRAIGRLMRQGYHTVSFSVWTSHRCLLERWTRDIMLSQVWIRVRCAGPRAGVGSPPAGLFGLNADKSPSKCHNSPLIVRLEAKLGQWTVQILPPTICLVKMATQTPSQDQKISLGQNIGESMIYV